MKLYMETHHKHTYKTGMKEVSYVNHKHGEVQNFEVIPEKSHVVRICTGGNYAQNWSLFVLLLTYSCC
jgi:hypothetical protein